MAAQATPGQCCRLAVEMRRYSEDEAGAPTQLRAAPTVAASIVGRSKLGDAITKPKAKLCALRVRVCANLMLI